MSQPQPMTPGHYYNTIRSEIRPLLPATAIRILDVGCGVGATSRWLKSLYPAARTIGFEVNRDLLPALAANVDDARIVDLNAALPDVGVPDLVLCLDILEHLVQPDDVLRRLVSIMDHRGTMIISLPNVANFRVAGPLFLFGRFDYQDAGILDRTHLRFFTRHSIDQLAERAGLQILEMVRNGLDPPAARRSNRVFNLLTGGLLDGRFTEQYVFAARRSAS